MNVSAHCGPPTSRLRARWSAIGRTAAAFGIAFVTVLSLATPAQAQEQKITLWHSMGAKNGEALNTLVERFNAQQAGKIKVEAIFQGLYNDTLSKLKASIQSRQLPDLVQVNEIGSRLVYDLKITVPYADVAKKYGFATDDLLKGIAAYYTIDGKLMAMPFNASAPMLYYNKTAFKEAGLDPEKPPRTLKEMRAAADKLVVRADGRVSRYGFTSAVDGWLIEQLMARANLDYCNEGNGRNGLATAVNWDQPAVRSIFQWWGDIMRDGVGVNAGRLNSDAIAAFTSGRAAMLLFTSANLRNIKTDSKFDVGIADYPSPESGMNGTVFNGGASIWVIAGRPPAAESAATKFVAYLGSPEAQAFWSTQTGYVPVNAKAIDLPEFRDAVKQMPDFAKPAAQLAQVGSTVASKGCFMGVMPQARLKMNDIMDAVLLGTAKPETALAEGQRAFAPQIVNYNRAIGR
jgi:sn-glycerol 3-phosphate transport system substrate-binding protein